ncbi:hypothetical protein I79_018457 [Cricetulus griseus]|uniref:Uncharacterized protein n=1 Tax=Cricetulus griseus TaxID=10029 RepID=G3I4S3_CRIGR|nr:hypothetical protein I79_018457 [Cricetulus griseus]
MALLQACLDFLGYSECVPQWLLPFLQAYTSTSASTCLSLRPASLLHTATWKS